MLEKLKFKSGGPNRRAAVVLFLFTILICSYLTLLGQRPLATPSEGRYAQIPTEMAQSGDWLTPRLNGVLYIEKPPMYYWLAASAITIFGNGEWQLRLVPALSALIICFAVFGVCSRIYNRRTGLYAALILGSSALFFGMSRALLTDMVFSMFVCLSLLLFMMLREYKNHAAKFLMCYAAIATCVALAILSKGLIGIVIPGLVVLAWCLCSKEWHLVFNRYLPLALVLLSIIAVPWHWYMEKSYPGFLDFYFVHEHFTRYLTQEHNRFKPWWFFIPVVFFGLMPWFLYLPQAIWHQLKNIKLQSPSPDLFLILWFLVPMVFLSLSNSKLVPYIIPLLPPLAILVARFLANPDTPIKPNWLYPVLMLGFSQVSVTVYTQPSLLPKNLQPLYSDAQYSVLGLGILCAIAAIMTFANRNVKPAFVPLMVVFSLGFNLLGDRIAGQFDVKTIKPLAIALKQQLLPDDRVASYGFYPQDLPYYIGRKIAIVNWQGELKYGINAEDQPNTMITEERFWRDWRQHKIQYLAIQKTAFANLTPKQQMKLTPILENMQIIIAKNGKRA